MSVAGKIFVALYRLCVILLASAAGAVLLLLLFGIRPYAVTTGSMEPTIPEGGICFVNERASFDDVREGDIIVFRVGELLVTHRAVKIDAGGVTTKGDANNTEDLSGKVRAESFVGTVIFWIPLVGRVLIFARTITGKAVIIGSLALFLAAGLLYDRLTENKEEK